MKHFENSVSLHETNATSVYKCSVTSQPKGIVGNSQSPRAAGCKGAGIISKADLSDQREVVNAFSDGLARRGFRGVLAVLGPNLVVHLDEAAARPRARSIPRRYQNAASNTAGL